jgi:hypothetical protein
LLIKTEIEPVPELDIVLDISVVSEEPTNDTPDQLAEISEEERGDDVATFTLGMAGADGLTGTDEATVTVTVGGTATGGTDYTPAVLAAIAQAISDGSFGSVLVLAGNVLTVKAGAPTSLDFLVTAQNDFDVEGTEDIVVTLSNPTLNVDGLVSILAGADAGTVDITERDVDINIKLGSDPNSINTCSGGATPVTIWGSATLEVAKIDADTLVLNSNAVKTVGKSGKILCSIEDVGSFDDQAGFDSFDPVLDNIDDLTCHFVTFKLTAGEDPSETAVVKGDGCDSATNCLPDDLGFFSFEGADAVNIVKECM